MRFLASKRLILILLGLAWLKSFFLPLCSIGGIKPDFFLIFLAFFAFQVSWKGIVRLAFVVGLIQDLMTNSFFGLETASYVGGTILLRFLAIQLDRDKPWIQLASLFAFSWFTLLLFVLFSFLVGEHYPIGEWLGVKTFLIAAYTTAVGFLTLPLFAKWLRPALESKQYELF